MAIFIRICHHMEMYQQSIQKLKHLNWLAVVHLHPLRRPIPHVHKCIINKLHHPHMFFQQLIFLHGLHISLNLSSIRLFPIILFIPMDLQHRLQFNINHHHHQHLFVFMHHQQL